MTDDFSYCELAVGRYSTATNLTEGLLFKIIKRISEEL
jgi:hypothetical protein